MASPAAGTASSTAIDREPTALPVLACAGVAFLLGAVAGAAGLDARLALALGAAAAPAGLRRGGWRRASLVLVCGLALALGCWRYGATVYRDGPDRVAHYVGNTVIVDGVVDGEPQPSGRGENLPVGVTSLVVGGRMLQVSGRILVHYTGPQAVEYGDLVSLRGRLLPPYSAPGFDYAGYLARQDIHAVLSFPGLQLLGRGQGNPLQGLALGLRDALRHAIARMLPHEEAALLAGILLGAPTHSLGALTSAFVAVGLIHVVAISGLKVALVAGTVTTLCARLPLRLRWAPPLAIVLLYTLISGATPSGLRAALMWGLALAALQFGRTSYVWVSLAVVAAGLVCWHPLLIWDSGFQLSVVGTAGIVLFTPAFDRWLRWLPPVIRESLAVSLAAQIATLPLTAIGFGQVSLVSPLANGLLLPSLGPIMVLGGFAALLTALVPPLAAPLAYLVQPLLAGFISVVRLLAGLPFASVPWPGVPPPLVVGYYALLALFALRLARAPIAPLPRVPSLLDLLARVPRTMLAGLVASGVAGGVALERTPDRPTLWVAGIGGGQTLLLQTPRGQAVLLDGGGLPAALQGFLGEHLPFQDRALTAVFLSEPDQAHLAGLLGLSALYALRGAYDPGAIYPSINPVMPLDARPCPRPRATLLPRGARRSPAPAACERRPSPPRR